LVLLTFLASPATASLAIVLPPDVSLYGSLGLGLIQRPGSSWTGGLDVRTGTAWKALGLGAWFHSDSEGAAGVGAQILHRVAFGLDVNWDILRPRNGRHLGITIGISPGISSQYATEGVAIGRDGRHMLNRDVWAFSNTVLTPFISIRWSFEAFVGIGLGVWHPAEAPAVGYLAFEFGAK